MSRMGSWIKWKIIILPQLQLIVVISFHAVSYLSFNPCMLLFHLRLKRLFGAKVTYSPRDYAKSF